MAGEGKAGEGFLVCWDGDRWRPGGQMIPCGIRTEEDGWGGGTLDGRRIGWGGSNK